MSNRRKTAHERVYQHLKKRHSSNWAKRKLDDFDRDAEKQKEAQHAGTSKA